MTSSEQPTLIADGAPPNPKAHGPFAALRRALPSGEVIRFLMVGGFNTVFSLILYSGLVLLFSRLFPALAKPLVADIAGAIRRANADKRGGPARDGRS